MDILKLLRKKAPLFNPTHKRVKTPTVLQMEALECGAASLAMILAYYGSYIPLEQLRVACGVSRDGSKASNVVKAARRFGLEADGYKRELTGLMKISYPAVIFWNFNHFVVLEGFSGRKAYINDPGGGRRAVSYNDFSESYTGVVLEFSKSEQFKPVGKKPSIIPAIRKRMAGLNHIAVYILLSGLFLIVPGIIVPAFSRFFVDDILIKHMTGFFKPLLLAMALTGIVQVVIQCLQQFCMQRFHISFSLSSACKFMQHLFLLPSEFFVQRMPGEISSRIALNPNIADLITTKLTGALINLICIVFYGILMFRYDVKLTCLCLVVCALNFLVLKLSENSIKVGSLKLQMEAGKLGGQTMGGIGMMESIKASGLENDFFQQWAGQQAKVVLQEQKMTVLSIAVTNIPQALTKLLNLAVLAVGALEVMNGRMTMGMLTAFQSLQVSFINPVNLFMGLATEIQTAKADMQRLDDVMDYPVAKRYLDDFHPERVVADTDYSFVSANDKLQGALTFKNVTFGYSRLEPPLIKDLNIDLKPGMRVALVGSTGSGKSTIGKLVSSQYQPWSGEILYDGLPLSEIERSRFTSSVACVDQDIFLFEGTVKENITMWDTAIPEDMYVQAAKDACIHDIITERPGGYSAKLNEGGANLSGGQRQRLEIARALAINPRILVLDEATSALDAVTEMQVDEHIRQRGCTCVIIAHRLSTIRDCDEIIVLDRGKVVQRGTHESLVAEDGLYADLIRTM